MSTGITRDITNITVGHLTALCPTDKKYSDGSHLWKIRCNLCGNIVYKTSTQFLSGNSVSCGCFRIKLSRKKNRHITLGTLTVLFDSKGNKCYIDTEDYERVKPYYWFQSRGYFYTVTGRKHCRIQLHRFILSDCSSIDIDHRNRKKWDNRKKNLRPATRAENIINRDVISTNKTGYTGVSFSTSRGKYRAYITVDGHQKHLGFFDDPVSAYNARLKAERKYYKDFSSKEVMM